VYAEDELLARIWMLLPA